MGTVYSGELFLSGDKSIISASSQHMNPFMPSGLNVWTGPFPEEMDFWLVFILPLFYRNTCI